MYAYLDALCLHHVVCDLGRVALELLPLFVLFGGGVQIFARFLELFLRIPLNRCRGEAVKLPHLVCRNIAFSQGAGELHMALKGTSSGRG